MGTILIRLTALLVIWTALSLGITWVLRVYGHVDDWMAPLVVLMVAGTSLSVATAIGMGYLERRYL